MKVDLDEERDENIALMIVVAFCLLIAVVMAGCAALFCGDFLYEY